MKISLIIFFYSNYFYILFDLFENIKDILSTSFEKDNLIHTKKQYILCVAFYFFKNDCNYQESVANVFDKALLNVLSLESQKYKVILVFFFVLTRNSFEDIAINLQ